MLKMNVGSFVDAFLGYKPHLGQGEQRKKLPKKNCEFFQIFVPVLGLKCQN
jgi:hypothetical protein